MSMEATAEALVTDAAQAENVAEAPKQELSEGDELNAVWDKMQAEPKEEPVEAPATAAANEPDNEEPEQPEEAEEAPEIEVPTDMPKAVRDAWRDIPEEARNAVLESHRKMGRQLAEQGRIVHGIKPIQDVLVQAVKDLPALANMRPEDVGKEVMQLAKISNDFAQKPVETMMSLIKQHRLEEPLRKIFAGEPPDQASLQSNELQKQVQQLQRQLAQVSDPEYLRGQVEQFTTQSQVQSSVEQFAQTAEHWNVVEEHMPYAIQFIKASDPNASPMDALSRAYDLAVSQFVPNASKAKQDGPADKATPVADPQKTQAARKAKSVNIRSNATGNQKTLTEEEELAKVFDKLNT